MTWTSREVLAHPRSALQRALDRAHERLLLDRLAVVRQILSLSIEAVRCGRVATKTSDLGPAHALDEDTDALVGELEHPHDDRDGPDREQIGLPRILLVLVALACEQDHPVLGERPVHRLHRDVPGDDSGAMMKGKTTMSRSGRTGSSLGSSADRPARDRMRSSCALDLDRDFLAATVRNLRET
jgi:hypothetical protein